MIELVFYTYVLYVYTYVCAYTQCLLDSKSSLNISSYCLLMPGTRSATMSWCSALCTTVLFEWRRSLWLAGAISPPVLGSLLKRAFRIPWLPFLLCLPMLVLARCCQHLNIPKALIAYKQSNPQKLCLDVTSPTSCSNPVAFIITELFELHIDTWLFDLLLLISLHDPVPPLDWVSVLLEILPLPLILSSLTSCLFEIYFIITVAGSSVFFPCPSSSTFVSYGST